MKITDVKATVLRTHSVFVQVFTDEGVVGIGECSPMNSQIIANFVDEALKPIIINENTLEIDEEKMKSLAV